MSMEIHKFNKTRNIQNDQHCTFTPYWWSVCYDIKVASGLCVGSRGYKERAGDGKEGLRKTR